jgi:hypothetical protein
LPAKPLCLLEFIGNFLTDAEEEIFGRLDIVKLKYWFGQGFAGGGDQAAHSIE